MTGRTSGDTVPVMSQWEKDRATICTTPDFVNDFTYDANGEMTGIAQHNGPGHRRYAQLSAGGWGGKCR